MSTYDTELDSINNICSLTEEILELSNKINSEVKDKDVSNYCYLISAKMRMVRHKAKKMEARMRDYRKSIENLGFRRIRKKRKNEEVVSA